MLFAFLPLSNAEDAAPGSELLDVYQTGNLAVLHDADGEWQAEFISEGNIFGPWYRESVRGAFLRGFDDEYTFLTVLVLSDTLGSIMAFAPYANDVSGIGMPTYDTSDGALEGMLSFSRVEERWLNCDHCLRYGFGQELMHRWGAYVQVDREDLAGDVLLGRSGSHWSYFLDTPNSPMEGNRWVDNGDGTWTTDTTDYAYSELDLYLMGLVGEGEVGPMTVLDVTDEDAAAAGVTAETSPAIQTGDELTLTALPVTVRIEDIVAAEGPRLPSTDDGPRDFRMAFVVLVLLADTLDEARLAAVDALRIELETDWEEDVGGRADLDTTLGATTAATWGDEDERAVATEQPGDRTGCGCQSGTGGAPLGLLLVFAGFVRFRARNRSWHGWRHVFGHVRTSCANGFGGARAEGGDRIGKGAGRGGTRHVLARIYDRAAGSGCDSGGHR